MYSSNLSINNFIISVKNWEYFESLDRARNTLESAYSAGEAFDDMRKSELALTDEEFKSAVRVINSSMPFGY